AVERALVFSRTKHGADRIVKLLAASGVASNAIHGNKSQPQRERALAEFKAGKVKVLIATDIAARGIDVSGVSHVFNFELPNVPDQYVHRIGRTARAGASGIAVSYCADDERPYLRYIEKLTRQKVTIKPLPDGFMAESARIKATRGPVTITRDEQNGRNGRTMQDRNASYRSGQKQRDPRANPVGGDRPRGDRPQGDRQTLGTAAPRGEGDAPRFYGPRKKTWAARPAGGGGGGGKGSTSGARQGGNR
ncbi:helicase-related protein, partial [Sphingomonas sp. ZT3P38]|uniref:helicase-related protein n=1 Tax=Parasphingomonas zepuensis TaxID=3096161 RepID=UPI002FC6C89F